MIVIPYKCVNFNAENFKTNLNKTCIDKFCEDYSEEGCKGTIKQWLLAESEG